MITRTFDQSFSKLASHLRKHFGVQTRFLNIQELSNMLDAEALTTLQKNERTFWGESLLIPVLKKDNLFGAAFIERLGRENDESEKIHTTVNLLLESTLEGLDEINSLKDFENIIYNNDRESNVISLNDYRLFTSEGSLAEYGSDAEITNISSSSRPNDRTRLNFPFIIESRDPDDIFKMALEIHYHSARYACLNIHDLDLNQFQSVTDLKSLGAVTLFIPNLAKLSPVLQNLIIEFFKSERDSNCPQFIAGTCLPISETRKSALIKSELIDSLLVGYLTMSEPFSSYKTQDMMAFFFESLTGRSSSSLDV